MRPGAALITKSALAMAGTCQKEPYLFVCIAINTDNGALEVKWPSVLEGSCQSQVSSSWWFHWQGLITLMYMHDCWKGTLSQQAYTWGCGKGLSNLLKLMAYPLDWWGSDSWHTHQSAFWRDHGSRASPAASSMFISVSCRFILANTIMFLAAVQGFAVLPHSSEYLALPL